jgi:hypothetical protein
MVTARPFEADLEKSPLRSSAVGSVSLTRLSNTRGRWNSQFVKKNSLSLFRLTLPGT